MATEYSHSDTEDVPPLSKQTKDGGVKYLGDKNLMVMHSSKLGKSAPSLLSSSNNKESRQINYKINRSQQRKSFIINTSAVTPRCSPMPGSPIDTPKIHIGRQFPFLSSRKQFSHLSAESKDGRRWSVASLPTSGYDTNSGSSNISSQCSSQELLHHLPNVPTREELRFLSEHFSSNDSNPSADDECCSRRKSSFVIRPRSRSLSSSERSPRHDNNIIVSMNELYKERFPNATTQMEQRLKRFINENDQTMLTENVKNASADAAPIIRFVHHQVLEIARDCLITSEQKLITSSYFYEITENLEKLLAETKDKSVEAAALLYEMVKKFLLIISRPARLLECLEFDPEEFYHLLETEGQAKISCGGIKTDLPQYIIGKLGLNRDLIGDLDGKLGFNRDVIGDKLEFNRDLIGELDIRFPDSSCENSPKKAVVDYSSDASTSDTSNQSKKDTFSKRPPTAGDFEVIKLISNGAYGAVYLVRHCDTRQRFAMKKIVKNNVILRNQIDQVFAERDIMSFTDNPFVVTMYCSFETKKYLCLVMEYVEGGDCASLLKSIGPLPQDIARFYFAETVLAVEYLHSYGIVHRDLKPDNLLITALGHIKLTDFGLSKMGLMSLATHLYEIYADKDTKQFSDKQVYGTPEYIAPEVILRQGYGKPVDWWSMGIILYEFLIGCVPFFGETPEELFAHTVNDDIEWPNEEDWQISPDAKDLIVSLLQQNPRDRLGAGGSQEVKQHSYFDNVDWDSLLRKKAQFVPQLIDEEDTSYFDSRIERYKHDDLIEDLDDNDESLLLGTFSSCSSHFHKVTSQSNISDQLSRSYESSSESHDASSLLHHRSLEHVEMSTVENADLCENILTTSESSQNESDISPKIRRKKSYPAKGMMPRFSISFEKDSWLDSGRDLFQDYSKEDGDKSKRQSLNLSEMSLGSSSYSTSKHHHHRSRSLVKRPPSVPPTLSLFIPPDRLSQPVKSPGSSSTASSRDASPCQELSPLISNLKPPLIIRRGPRGFGFTVHTIRVYYGDTDFYTMHHLVMAVDDNGPAFEAGLRVGDLITHINGEPIQGLYHTQVLHVLLSGENTVSLRAAPLESTSIKTNGRKRHPNRGKLAMMMKKPTTRCRRTSRKHSATIMDSSCKLQYDIKQPSLLATIHNNNHKQMVEKLPSTSPNHTIISATLNSGRNLQSYARSISVQEPIQSSSSVPSQIPSLLPSASGKISILSPDPFILVEYPSSSSLSSSSSSSNSPCLTPSNSFNSPYQRPSSLHGLKHKLQSTTKNIIHSPNRRKSVGHIPLSPLARTPSPSPLPSSPTRSTSPLVFPSGHHPGSSNTTQTYSPSTLSPHISTPICPANKKTSFGRPKNSEPNSPLLRRALSPDRMHHSRNVENKNNSISPLCDQTLKVTIHAPRITVTSKSPPNSSRSLKEHEFVTSKLVTESIPTSTSSLSIHRVQTMTTSCKQEEETSNYSSNIEQLTDDVQYSSIADNDENSKNLSDDMKTKQPADLVIGGSDGLPRIVEEKDNFSNKTTIIGNDKVSSSNIVGSKVSTTTVSSTFSCSSSGIKRLFHIKSDKK